MPGPAELSFNTMLDKTPALAPVLLCCASAVLFLPGLGNRDLWAPGEPIYGEVIRSMFEKHEWLVPTLNGQLFPDKPALYYWLALVISKLSGSVSEWTLRLPAALAGMGLVLVTYEFGRRFFDRRSGFFAALILASTSRILWESRFLRLDTVLAFFLFSGFYFFVRAFAHKGAPSFYLYAYLCFALATLTKGPIGLALPGLAVILLLFATAKWQELRNMRLISGSLLVIGVLSPWLVLLHLQGQDRWLREFILIHNVQNYALEPIGHVRPFYYYFINLPPDFLPWILLIPGALLYYYPWHRQLRDPVSLALWCWFAAIFLFFSLSKSKIAYYLLPLLPSLAILAGRYCSVVTSSRDLRGVHWRCTKILLYVFSAVLMIGGLALPFVTYRLEHGLFGWAIPLSIVLVIGSGATIFFVYRKRPFFCFSVLMTTVIVVAALAGIGVLPYLDKYKSPRPIAEFIKARVPADVPVYIYQSTMADFNFYSGRERIPVVGSAQEIESLQKRDREAYLLINEKDLSEIAVNRSQQVAMQQRIGDRTWYLLKLI